MRRKNKNFENRASDLPTIDNLTKILSRLWLTERCVYMRVCKHGCDVSVVHSILIILLKQYSGTSI